MNKKYILFITAIVLIVFMFASFTGILFNDENASLQKLFIGLLIGFTIAFIIVMVIIIIFFPPDFSISNPEEDDLRVYALKNGKYHHNSRRNGLASHPLGDRGSVAKHKGHVNNKLKFIFMIIGELFIMALFPLLIINQIDSVELKRKAIIISALCIFVPLVIGEIIIFFSKKKEKIDTIDPLIDLIENDEALELVDNRFYKNKTYFELKIDDSRGFFEVSKNRVMAIVLGEKELTMRDNANEKAFSDGLITSNEVNEQLEGVIALSKKYRKPITKIDDKETLKLIKNIVSEYKNKKPSIFDKLNEEIKKDN